MKLTGKEREILEVFKRQAQARFPGLISDVIVHGSKARGDATEFSDIDVLVIVHSSTGQKNSITLPPHPDCRIDDKDIVATFHTHPNTGSDHLQEPSETDRRAVRDDPDLKGVDYEGEFVISQDKIYLVSPNGEVSEVGATLEILG